MATRANNAAKDFLTAAQDVVRRNEASLKKEQAQKRLEERQRQRDEKRRRHDEKIYSRRVAKAFNADIAKYLDPVAEAMLALPAQGGREFLMGGSIGLARDWSSQEDKRALDLHFIYSTPRRADKSDPTLHPLELYEKGAYWTVQPEVNDKPVLKISLSHDFLTGEFITATTVKGEVRTDRAKPYYTASPLEQEELNSFADIPAAIGRWVAQVAPERLPELREVLKGAARPKRKSPAPA